MYFFNLGKLFITSLLRSFTVSRILQVSKNILLSFKFEKVNVPENNFDVNITVQTIGNNLNVISQCPNWPNVPIAILINYCRRRKLNYRFSVSVQVTNAKKRKS